MDLTPPVLRGRHVTLEPLEERHAADLFAAMQDEEVCRYLAWPPPAAGDATLVLIREAPSAGRDPAVAAPARVTDRCR